eukprot:scaffold32564_cov60-Phaeocystis_antarctica.AAC.4
MMWSLGGVVNSPEARLVSIQYRHSAYSHSKYSGIVNSLEARPQPRPQPNRSSPPVLSPPVPANPSHTQPHQTHQAARVYIG